MLQSKQSQISVVCGTVLNGPGSSTGSVRGHRGVRGTPVPMEKGQPLTAGAGHQSTAGTWWGARQHTLQLIFLLDYSVPTTAVKVTLMNCKDHQNQTWSLELKLVWDGLQCSDAILFFFFFFSLSKQETWLLKVFLIFFFLNQLKWALAIADTSHLPANP